MLQSCHILITKFLVCSEIPQNGLLKILVLTLLGGEGPLRFRISDLVKDPDGTDI